jgi:hypothetical protein
MLGKMISYIIVVPDNYNFVGGIGKVKLTSAMLGPRLETRMRMASGEAFSWRFDFTG